MKNVSDWVFNYNEQRKLWQAAKRENYNELFSGDKGGVLRSSSFNTLIELIIKTNGNKEKLNKLVHEN